MTEPNREDTVSDDERTDDAQAEPGPVHPLQRLMDNPWLLLVLGIVIPTLSYTVWGIIDLVMLPEATLP